MMKKNNKKMGDEARGELLALRQFFAYNTFVRKKYTRFITRLPVKTRTKDRGASFPSLLDILTHILDVDRSWIHAHDTGEDLPSPKGLSVSQIRKLEKQVDSKIENFMKRLRPQDLDKSFQWTVNAGEKSIVNTSSTRDMLYHMVEEELQHRGELNALLWQEDIEPPVTDWYDWKEAA